MGGCNLQQQGQKGGCAVRKAQMLLLVFLLSSFLDPTTSFSTSSHYTSHEISQKEGQSTVRAHDPRRRKAAPLSALFTPQTRGGRSNVDDDDDDNETTKAANLKSFQTSSKKQGKVIVDPRTGLYRPMKTLPNLGGGDGEDEDGILSAESAWDGFKSVVYNSVDTLKTQVPRTVQKIQETVDEINNKEPKPDPSVPGMHFASEFRPKPPPPPQSKSPGKTTLSELSSSASPSSPSPSRSQKPIVGSYTEREQAFLSRLDLESTETPKRLVSEFKPSSESLNLPDDIGGDEELMPPSPFESFKSIVYKGIDAVTSSSDSDGSSKTQRTSASSQDARISKSTPSKRLAASSMQTRERKARLLASDAEFVKAIEELQSDNPLTRMAAGYKVRQMVDKDGILQQERQKAAERQERIDAIKSNIYAAGDAVASGAQALVELPKKVTETYDKAKATAEETVRVAKALPGQVREQVDSFQRTVEDVQHKVEEVQQSVQDGVERTKQLPQEISTKVKETTDSVKNTAQQTKDTLDGIGRTAQDLTTSSKVLLGLEKPVPKPPKETPSKEQQEGEWSASKLGWKALSATGSLAGKVTWIVGKETTKLAWKGASFAVSKGKEALDEAAAKEKRRNELAKDAFRTKEAEAAKLASAQTTEPVAKPKKAPSARKEEKQKVASVKPPKRPSSIDSGRLARKQAEMDMAVLDLEQEIAEALRLAEDSIESAKTDSAAANKEKKKKKSKSNSEMGIAEALRLADEAIESAQAEIDEQGKRKL